MIQAAAGDVQGAKRTVSQIDEEGAKGPSDVTAVWFCNGQPVYDYLPMSAGWSESNWRGFFTRDRVADRVPSEVPPGLPSNYLAADPRHGAVVDFAAPMEINVIVENHGGLSSNGAWLASVIEAVGHPGCGTLPDFGNFDLGDGVWYDRYQGVAELMPHAKAVSAKSHAFDEQGNERGTDFFRMMRIVLAAGYRGYVGIEYEGVELQEMDGIRATKALLERVREALAAG